MGRDKQPLCGPASRPLAACQPRPTMTTPAMCVGPDSLCDPWWGRLDDRPPLEEKPGTRLPALSRVYQRPSSREQKALWVASQQTERGKPKVNVRQMGVSWGSTCLGKCRRAIWSSFSTTLSQT